MGTEVILKKKEKNNFIIIILYIHYLIYFEQFKQILVFETHLFMGI